MREKVLGLTAKKVREVATTVAASFPPWGWPTPGLFVACGQYLEAIRDDRARPASGGWRRCHQPWAGERRAWHVATTLPRTRTTGAEHALNPAIAAFLQRHPSGLLPVVRKGGVRSDIIVANDSQLTGIRCSECPPLSLPASHGEGRNWGMSELTCGVCSGLRGSLRRFRCSGSG